MEEVIDRINDILFDALARRCSVYIEGAGTLEVKSENLITEVGDRVRSYPYYRIDLVREKRFGTDLKAATLGIEGVTPANVDDVFSTWRIAVDITGDDTDFIIDGVIEYKDGELKMSRGLNHSLNPNYAEEEVKKVAKSSRKVASAFFFVSIVALGLVVWLLVYMLPLSSDTNSEDEDVWGWPVNEAAAIGAPVGLEEETVVVEAEPVTVKAESVAVKAEPVKVKTEPVAVKAEPEEPVVQDKFYIVVSAFKSHENAKKELNSLKKFPKREIVRTGELYYVTVDNFNSYDEAERYRDRNKEITYWIYNIKNNN